MLDSFLCKIVGQDLMKITNMNWLIAAFPRFGKKSGKMVRVEMLVSTIPQFPRIFSSYPTIGSSVVQQLVLGQKGKLEMGSLLTS